MRQSTNTQKIAWNSNSASWIPCKYVMRIRLIGQRNTTGIGTHYACFADQIKHIHDIGHLVEEVDFQNDQQIQQAISTSNSQDINISFVGASIHEHFLGTNIQWIVFESNQIPENILPCLVAADQVWVPSDWGRGVLLSHGIVANRIHVVPEGVNIERFHAHGRQPWSPSRPFRFLTVGKYEQRKGIDEILEAWAQTHANRPDLELIIKSNYFIDHEQKFQDLKNKINSLGLNNVTVLWGEMSESELAELYRSCDTFVLPSRAEGWGLPLIEAAATGLPIISTMYSGHTEFLNHITTSVLPVDYVMVPIDCPEYCRYYPSTSDNWGTWARPDVYSIGVCMQAACREVDTLYKNAQHNSSIIRNNFSWFRSVDRAVQILYNTVIK
jgi:glycosyltransferase involved in cell wall biosynthesis